MSLKNLKSEYGLALASGACLALSFLPFHIAPLLVAHAALLLWACLTAQTVKRAFWAGVIVSFVFNLLIAWWLTYAIHVFGYLPYPIAALIFLVFCSGGAVNFPLFALFTFYFSRRYQMDSRGPLARGFWLVIALPAAFVVVEWISPKLFPSYIGHALYWLPLLTQISELTGAIFLSFLAMSLGGSFVLLAQKKYKQQPISWSFFSVPWVLLLFVLSFGTVRIAQTPPEMKRFRVALIQANIGSLEKVQAEKGYYPKVRKVISEYKRITQEAIASGAKPDLVVWPETAMPIQLDRPSAFSTEVFRFSKEIGVPLLTGGYSTHPLKPQTEYNAAFLISPTAKFSPEGVPALPDPYSEIYRKNVLLAFGEYFPFGETFPVLYQWFPQVAAFGRGTEQNYFTLPNQMRLGITICYEAIVPEFFRRTAEPGVNAVINLTNDSWFGPTTEPYHHGALSIFRSVETRLPLIRVANTGISFFVDRLGRMSRTTKVYEPGYLVEDIELPLAPPPPTLYLRWGDWFVALCAFVLLATVLTLRRLTRVSLSH